MNYFIPSQVVCYNVSVVNKKLYVATFIIGAVVMIFELVGSRIISPYLGSTILTWTAIVGTLLAFLSLGYFIGGRHANKFDLGKLSLLVMGAGYWLIFVAFFKEKILYSITLLPISEALKAVLASIFLFSVFSVALGAVTPIIAGIAIKSLKESGKITGYLWAVSTIGSIFGTFFAGFWLIPAMGSLRLIYLMAATLSLTAILLSSRRFLIIKLLHILTSIFGVIFSWQLKVDAKGLIADIETTMYRVWIVKKNKLTKMYLDQALSSRFQDGINELSFRSYYKYYDLMFWNKQPKNIVMIGGAGMTYPRYALYKYPGISMEVVEIDPMMEGIASKYLSYKKSPKVKVINMDGRVFFRQNKKKYDAILIDAFTGKIIPFHIVTREALMQMRDSLDDDGVVVINVYGALEGSDSQLFRSILTTFKDVFNETKVFAVTDKNKTNKLQSLVILASNNISKEPSGLIKTDEPIFLSKEVKKEITFGELLTDDWAPVDYWGYKQETY